MGAGARIGTAVLLSIVFAFSMHPGIGYATWPLASGRTVLLGFGGSYETTPGASATHRGADIAGAAGARVLAPTAGTVTFAGRVPAVGGGTCAAVTIAVDGESLTLLPLSSIAVKKGEAVAAGDMLGELAPSGDASSRATHLHAGLRQGDLYLDPLAAFAKPADPSGESGAQDAEHGGQAAPVPAERGEAAAVADSWTGAKLPGVTGSAAVGAQATGSRSLALHPPVAGEQLASGVSVAGAPTPGTVGQTVPVLYVQTVPGELGGVVRAERRASDAAAAAAAAEASSLASRVASWTQHAARVACLAAVGGLLALGLLRPLWRPRDGEGSSELLVRPLSDDVAAAVGR